jgi:glycosyltransferase involved in cell wall biosynthesis
MGKVKSHTPVLKKKFYPFVSVCTPTFNRRPFIPMMFECFKNQTYPKDRMEWIIVDDGTDKIRDLVEASGIKQIKYVEVENKMTLGAKRNYMHSFVKGTIIVYMDDDDYYPPERVSHAVDKLMANRNAMCAGSSELYIYFKHIQTMYKCGPYGPNHATAGTFAFRTDLLKESRYQDNACLAEEKHFLKDYTVPFVQLDPMKTILVFSHIHNTFDKKKLLENPHPDYLRPWNAVTVDMFISQKEASIKDFFLNKIDDLLNAYEPGDPKMKPDVIKQTKEIEEERAKMAQEQMKQMHNTTMTSIVMSKDGQPPRQLSQQDVLDIINGQKESIEKLLAQNEELQKITIHLQQQLMQMQSGMPLPPPPQSSNDEKYKQEINALKNKIELLEKQAKDYNSNETPKEDVIEIDMSRPKSEPEVFF